MKKFLILNFLLSGLFSGITFASNLDFETTGRVKSNPNSYTKHDDLDRAKKIARNKADSLCQSEATQLSEWNITGEKKFKPGVFGGPRKVEFFVLAKALFSCEPIDIADR